MHSFPKPLRILITIFATLLLLFLILNQYMGSQYRRGCTVLLLNSTEKTIQNVSLFQEGETDPFLSVDAIAPNQEKKAHAYLPKSASGKKINAVYQGQNGEEIELDLVTIQSHQAHTIVHLNFQSGSVNLGWYDGVNRYNQSGKQTIRNNPFLCIVLPWWVDVIGDWN